MRRAGVGGEFGAGTWYSYTVVHRAPRPQFEVPYIVAIIALDEGWHMLSNVLECAPADIAVDLRVRVNFRTMSDEITLPYFVPARGI
ncbi:MAG: OB-fold domain-containing protein [Halioglobus sp.]